MRRVLMTPFPFVFGIIDKHINVARQLRKHGYEAYIYTDEETISTVKSFDLPFRNAAVERTKVKIHELPPEQRLKARQDYHLNSARRTAPDIMRIIQEEHIDAVMVDQYSVGAAFAAERLGIPWATYVSTPWSLTSHLKADPMFQLDPNPIRQELGLPPTDRSWLDQSRSPRLILCGWVPEFDFSPLPEQAVHIGPPAYTATEEPPAWLKQLGDERPLVMATTTTRQMFKGINVECVVEALKGLPINAVVTLANGEDPTQHPGSDNVRVEGFIPHGAILPRASVAVIHGGAGVLNRSLALGIPMIIVPGESNSVGDQLPSGQRCEELGVGTLIRPEHLTPQLLRETLLRLLEPNSSYHTKAKQFAAKLKDYHSRDLASLHISRLLDGPRS